MALTIAISDKTVFGNRKVRMGTITFDSDYVGGESYTAAMFALGKITRLKVSPALGYVPSVDAANLLVKVYYGDYSEAADGALVECADNTNLSSLVVDFEVYGYGG